MRKVAFAIIGCYVGSSMQNENLKALLLTNEYPPHVYGGAGVHVDYLSRELAKLCRVDLRCFGDQQQTLGNLSVTGFQQPRNYQAPKPLHRVFDAVQQGLDFNSSGIDADVVHAHTWYAHFGGLLAKLNYGIPLVVTVHSLEPLRPWKKEQLGGGYDFSCWVEKAALQMADAVIAVSAETQRDITRFFNIPESKIHIIHNGIDTDEYQPVRSADALQRFGIRADKPYVLFVGRITRQKGIIHLVRAISHLHEDFQVVLCASAPDTPEIGEEMKRLVEQIQVKRQNVIWINEMVDNPTKIALYSHAAVFCCPSVYEPFGIINLEAMACEAPVVASAVGGIPEVVEDHQTGYLVPVNIKDERTFELENPDAFSEALAEKINHLMKHPELQKQMGQAGRRKAISHFSWKSIAKKTLDLYASLCLKRLS